MGESSESIHHHVQAARNIPLNRFTHSQTIHSHSIDNICKADMLVGELRQYGGVQTEWLRSMKVAIRQSNLCE